MGIVLKVALVLVAVIVAFIVRQYVSVLRGVRTRDRALAERLVPLGEKLERGESVGAAEVLELASAPELRGPLYRLLSSHGRRDLFPDRYLNRESEAVSELTYWLLHPHELQAVPESVEPVAAMHRDVGGRRGEFRVLRYRMAAGHWAGREWLLGVVGPFFEGEEAYNSVASAFSRVNDVHGRVTPESLVDWYVEMVRPRFAEAS